MKRTLCILLTLILVALCIPAVNAQTTGDKISPELRALIDANPDGGKENGVVVEVFHHNENYPTDGISEETAAIVQDNPKFPLTDEEKLAVENNLKAHAELIAQIGELTHMEPDGFAIGRCFIGLPYDAIDKVAALEATLAQTIANGGIISEVDIVDTVEAAPAAFDNWQAIEELDFSMNDRDRDREE